jgi:Arc/MetJ family transcription regulator
MVVGVSKKLIEVDDELLGQAREILGATSQRETVNRALEDVVRRHLRGKLVELLTSGRFDDLANPEIMAGAWRADVDVSH